MGEMPGSPGTWKRPTPNALRTEAHLHAQPAPTVSRLSASPSGEHLNTKRRENLEPGKQEAGLPTVAWGRLTDGGAGGERGGNELCWEWERGEE